jgi:hypothetical protein
MQQDFQLTSGPIYQAEKPVRKALSTSWIKGFTCIVCGSTRRIDPCHYGPHALSQKASDLKCIPLCRKHHDALDADPQGFAARHDLDIPIWIQFLSHCWDLKQRRTQ